MNARVATQRTGTCTHDITQHVRRQQVPTDELQIGQRPANEWWHAGRAGDGRAAVSE